MVESHSQRHGSYVSTRYTFAEERGIDLKIVKSTIEVNKARVIHAVEMIEEEVGNLNGKSICILGLAFKDNTNDLRESKSLELINDLKAKGANICVYDPVVKEVDGLKMVNKIEECEGENSRRKKSSSPCFSLAEL